jgi:hypothetical protein
MYLFRFARRRGCSPSLFRFAAELFPFTVESSGESMARLGRFWEQEISGYGTEASGFEHESYRIQLVGGLSVWAIALKSVMVEERFGRNRVEELFTL